MNNIHHESLIDVMFRDFVRIVIHLRGQIVRTLRHRYLQTLMDIAVFALPQQVLWHTMNALMTSPASRLDLCPSLRLVGNLSPLFVFLVSVVQVADGIVMPCEIYTPESSSIGCSSLKREALSTAFQFRKLVNDVRASHQQIDWG
jgi:hypothetical protein